MKLKTKRLILRNLKKGDEKDILENVNDLEVSRYLAVVPYPYTLDDAKWFVNHCSEKSRESPRKNYDFGVEFEGKIMGVISLSKVDLTNGVATFGLWLGKKYWRKGFMSEAAEALFDFAFDKLKLRRINSGAYVKNSASVNLHQKLGFVKEGLRRKGHIAKSTGKIHDEIIFGLLREDWKRHKNSFH